MGETRKNPGTYSAEDSDWNRAACCISQPKYSRFCSMPIWNVARPSTMAETASSVASSRIRAPFTKSFVKVSGLEPRTLNGTRSAACSVSGRTKRALAMLTT